MRLASGAGREPRPLHSRGDAPGLRRGGGAHRISRIPGPWRCAWPQARAVEPTASPEFPVRGDAPGLRRGGGAHRISKIPGPWRCAWPQARAASRVRGPLPYAVHIPRRPGGARVARSPTATVTPLWLGACAMPDSVCSRATRCGRQTTGCCAAQPSFSKPWQGSGRSCAAPASRLPCLRSVGFRDVGPGCQGEKGSSMCAVAVATMDAEFAENPDARCACVLLPDPFAGSAPAAPPPPGSWTPWPGTTAWPGGRRGRVPSPGNDGTPWTAEAVSSHRLGRWYLSARH